MYQEKLTMLLLPSLPSDCRYSRHPVPAVAGRDARRCLLPQRGRRLLCRQYSAPGRRWVWAGGSEGRRRGPAPPQPGLGGAAQRVRAGPVRASLRPAGVTVVPREERELRLVAPVGVSCAVQIRLLPAFKQISAEQTQNCTQKHIKRREWCHQDFKGFCGRGFKG